MTQETQNLTSFEGLSIDAEFLAVLKQKGFTAPTPIQEKVIPVALEGKDIVGIAQTGTGKTLAFGIPMIQRILRKKEQGLILVPTRELALQVDEAIRKIAFPFGLNCAVVIGGVSQHGQVKAIRRRPDIVIATPGRLSDLIKQRVYSLDGVKIITLDEGDRMLDMGFLPQIKQILQLATKDRQTMFFSATMPQSMASLANSFLRNPVRIEVASQGTSAENIEQSIFMVDKNSKKRLLDLLLQENDKEPVLIFSRTKYGVKRLASDIRSMNHTVAEIHSNRSQSQRKIALDGFRTGRFRVLVATDIAARGIDVKNISLVINYDLPDNAEDYVHRIGRTGRAGSSGKAISFVCHSEKFEVRKIERLMRKTLTVLPLPQLPPERERTQVEEDRPRFSNREERPRGNRRFGNRFSNREERPRSSGRFGNRAKHSRFGNREERPRYESSFRNRADKPLFAISDDEPRENNEERPRFEDRSKNRRFQNRGGRSNRKKYSAKSSFGQPSQDKKFFSPKRKPFSKSGNKKWATSSRNFARSRSRY